MNAVVKTILEQRNAVGYLDTAAEFSRAAEILYTATRSWPVLPPASRDEIDAVSRQLQGLQHALITLRTAAPQK